MRWVGVALNIEKRHLEMDLYIHSIKKKHHNYEDFLKEVEEIMIISFPDVFKKCYWDKNFGKDLLKRLETILNKSQYEVYNEIYNS